MLRVMEFMFAKCSKGRCLEVGRHGKWAMLGTHATSVRKTMFTLQSLHVCLLQPQAAGRVTVAVHSVVSSRQVSKGL